MKYSNSLIRILLLVFSLISGVSIMLSMTGDPDITTWNNRNNDEERILLPEDTIVKVQPCNEELFAVEDMILQDKIGKLPKPGSMPEFEGGLEALKEYFAANSLTNEKAKQMVFRVHIGFIVNCEGKAGNYEVISQGKGDLAVFANEVLAIVNKMPQSWKPAKKGGKEVDSYQVLSFTAVQGSLASVSYRTK